MAWNPSPEVARARDIGRDWNKSTVIIIAIDDEGQAQIVTYGKTRKLCDVAATLGQKAWEGICDYVGEE